MSGCGLKFNICVIKPAGYIHSAAFEELAELVKYGLIDLGHQALIHFNDIRPEATNLLIGCHLLDPAQTRNIPHNTIILNTEQIHTDDTSWKKIVLQWAAHFETWDYSARNLEFLRQQGMYRSHLLRIGYHRKLARIEKMPTEKIDVLFYGFVNERRKKILEGLAAAGLQVKSLTGVYGRERDKWIARSKVVLNMHYYQSKIFEVIRVFYLMTNAKAVVSEVNQDTAIDASYRAGIAGVPYEQLIETCQKYVLDEALRKDLEKRALATLQQLPQSTLLQPLLQPSG